MTSTTGSGCGGRAGWTTHADNATAHAITLQYRVKDAFSLIRFSLEWSRGNTTEDRTAFSCVSFNGAGRIFPSRQDVRRCNQTSVPGTGLAYRASPTGTFIANSGTAPLGSAPVTTPMQNRCERVCEPRPIALLATRVLRSQY